MTREMKCRGWTGDEMIYLPKMSQFEYGDLCIGFMQENEIYIDDYEGDEYFEDVMWRTGLKDKNGVEIYEGDIVESRYKKDGYDYFLLAEVIVSVLGTIFQPIKSNDDKVKSFNILHNATHITGGGREPRMNILDPNNLKQIASSHRDDEAKFEVIGNIYENSDLLNNNTND